MWDNSNKSRETQPCVFVSIMLDNLKIWEIGKVVNFGKRRAPKHPADPFNKCMEILDMGPISSRKHETEFCKSLKLRKS